MSLDGISNELDTLARSFKLHRFRTELEECQSRASADGATDPENQKRIATLQKILETIDTSKRPPAPTKKNDMFNEIDKYVYTKPWKKLPTFHKKFKIREYISLTYKETPTEGAQVEKLLLDAIDEGELNTDRHVTYDLTRCQVVGIPVLKCVAGAGAEGAKYTLDKLPKNKPRPRRGPKASDVSDIKGPQ